MLILNILYHVFDEGKQSHDMNQNVIESFIITNKGCNRHPNIYFENYTKMGLTLIRYNALTTFTDSLQSLCREKFFINGHESVYFDAKSIQFFSKNIYEYNEN